MNYYLRALKKYADFKGRDIRPQYWYFFLFNIIIVFVLGFIDSAIGTDNVSGYGFLLSLYSLAVLIPNLAAATRRLQDTGKSGWWILVSLIPVIGWIWIIILLAIKGEDKPNKYGPVPQVINSSEMKTEKQEDFQAEQRPEDKIDMGNTNQQ